MDIAKGLEKQWERQLEAQTEIIAIQEAHEKHILVPTQDFFAFCEKGYKKLSSIGIPTGKNMYYIMTRAK